MFRSRRGRIAGVAIAAAAVFSLAACGSSDTIEGGGNGGGETAETSTIRVGSANFAESEIIMEIYAQALENAGLTVERTPQIGARDVYVAAVEDGSIDLVPDYSGNLLQFFDPESDATTSEEVYDALSAAVPEGMEVLEQSEAENKDSYNVTQEFSEEHGITSLADLAGAGIPITVGGAPELAERPYGPQGLTDVYGVPADSITFTPISDGGGPLTSQALVDGTVDLADIYSTTPSIVENDFVTLEDPENMILPQNVLPLISTDAASDQVADVLNEVSAALTTDVLIELNGRNQGDEKASAAQVAEDWLNEAGLLN